MEIIVPVISIVTFGILGFAWGLHNKKKKK